MADESSKRPAQLTSLPNAVTKLSVPAQVSLFFTSTWLSDLKARPNPLFYHMANSFPVVSSTSWC